MENRCSLSVCRRFTPLRFRKHLKTTKIHSVAGKTGAGTGLLAQRPFRAPHHTISDVAMVGGGSFPQPGEISLAHNGVLFLDELPEFNRNVLEVLRQTSRRPQHTHLTSPLICRLSGQLHARSLDESLSLRLLQSPNASLCLHFRSGA